MLAEALLGGCDVPGLPASGRLEQRHIDAVIGDQSPGRGGPTGYAAIAGYPHLTVPMGRVKGLPLGLSFVGTKWDDARVLALGYAYEQASEAFVDAPLRASVEGDPAVAPLLAPVR